MCSKLCFFIYLLFGKLNKYKKVSYKFQILSLLIVDLYLFRVRMVTRCTTKCSRKTKFNRDENAVTVNG
jgi:hypothetical protein